ncbi:Eco57I restriction-modification methylase domain-containing protein [Micromonospora aurantiaca (nom. illeg.)]|uniref:Eco57I restriction-modification methylase domain-containing protein n=1 Tax=Micromonospora aurantiaca (nom. illeg.) TaxID=47850 RepID=UPI0033DE47B2
MTPATITLAAPAAPAPAVMPWLAADVTAAIPATAAQPGQQQAADAERYADVIASGADLLWAALDAGDAEATTAEVRHAIAHGLAILAHRPGGVTFAGLHFHADDCPDCPGPGTWSLPGTGVDRAGRGAFFTPRAWFTNWHQSASPEAAARVAALQCLHGVDVDPLSIELSRLALQLLVPHQQTALPNLRVGDALVGRGNPYLPPASHYPAEASRFDWDCEFPGIFHSRPPWAAGFDAIVGNPPYLGGNKITAAYGDAYRDHLAHAIAHGRRGPVDLAVYFWLRAHELTSERGTIGMICPASIDRGLNGRTWQSHLDKTSWQLYRQEPARRWPSRSAGISIRLLYSSMDCDIPPPVRPRPHRTRHPPHLRLPRRPTPDRR